VSSPLRPYPKFGEAGKPATQEDTQGYAFEDGFIPHHQRPFLFFQDARALFEFFIGRKLDLHCAREPMDTARVRAPGEILFVCMI